MFVDILALHYVGVRKGYMGAGSERYLLKGRTSECLYRVCFYSTCSRFVIAVKSLKFRVTCGHYITRISGSVCHILLWISIRRVGFCFRLHMTPTAAGTHQFESAMYSEVALSPCRKDPGSRDTGVACCRR